MKLILLDSVLFNPDSIATIEDRHLGNIRIKTQCTISMINGDKFNFAYPKEEMAEMLRRGGPK